MSVEFYFSDEEIQRMRSVLGSTILSTSSAHPHFEAMRWSGSSRLDVCTTKGDVGLRASYVNVDHPRLMGEFAQLSVFDPSTVSWPLADHKGVRHRAEKHLYEGATILSMRVLREHMELRTSHEVLRISRDFGFVIFLDAADDYDSIEGNDPLRTLFLGVVAGPHQLLIHFDSFPIPMSRFGIHSFPGNVMVDLQLGEELKSNIESFEVESDL